MQVPSIFPMLTDERFQAALRKLSPFAFAVYDLDDPRRSQNVGLHLAADLGYALEEYMGQERAMTDHVHPEDRVLVGKMIEEMRRSKGGEITEAQVRMIGKQGQMIWVASRAAVCERDAAGRPLRALAVFGKITRLKALEAELDERTKRLALISIKEAPLIQAEVRTILDLVESFAQQDDSALRQKKLIGYLRETVLGLKERARELAEASQTQHPPE